MSESFEVWTPDGLGLNNDTPSILKNIRANVCRQLPQAYTHDENDKEVAIVGTGPSLNTTAHELEALHAEGCKLVATNGAHDWLLDRGFEPSAMVMIDSRDLNARFVQRPVKKCKYFLSSGCHPSVYDALQGHDVYIFHPFARIGEKAILDAYYLGQYQWVYGGSTVGLRAMSLMRMLGFKKQHLFGMDSCLMDGEHHAVSAPEHDGLRVEKFRCADRTFLCRPWMAAQAHEFVSFIAWAGEYFLLEVHGDGLIAHIVRTGASGYEVKDDGGELDVLREPAGEPGAG